MKFNKSDNIIITPGSHYIDIDAYACCVAMAELLRLQGVNAVAYSNASCNYSICKSLTAEQQVESALPEGWDEEMAKYIIVDVSDPAYLSKSVPVENVVAVYDHHVGFEDYWAGRIGENSHIEFIGAAVTLIYRQWKKAGLAGRMTSETARLMIAAILDNTLNLTSAVTTGEDTDAFSELCKREGIGEQWCGAYFSEVQAGIEADLKNALFGDVKNIRDNPVLPSYMGQAAVWDVKSILGRMNEIREWFGGRYDSWMLNIVDIQHNCNYFVCDSTEHQKKIEKVYDVHFEAGIAKTAVSYLRKELIKISYFRSNF